MNDAKIIAVDVDKEKLQNLLSVIEMEKEQTKTKKMMVSAEAKRIFENVINGANDV